VARVQVTPETDTSYVLEPQAVGVETRETWDASAWTSRPYVEPLQAAANVQPTLSTASMVYRYGHIRRRDKATGSGYWPPDLVDHFVRFSVPTRYAAKPVHLPWYGVVVSDTKHVRGPYEDGGVITATGDVVYQCLGLEHLLDGARIMGATILDAGTWKDVTACPTFNLRHRKGGSPLGNCSAAHQTGTSVFGFSAGAAETRTTWSASDVIAYLLHHYAPTTGGLAWTLGGQLGILDETVDVWRLEGRTVREALNILVDRRRGQSWTLRVGEATDEGPPSIEVHVSTVYDRPMAFAGKTIQPNTEVAPLEVDTTDGDAAAVRALHRVATCHVRSSASQRYGRVIVLGERMRSCFTLAPVDSDLEAGWASADATALRAAGGEDDPALADRWRRRAANLSDVFRTFVVPDDWDYTAGNGEGGTRGPVAPVMNDSGSLGQSAGVITQADKRFLKWLPLEEPWVGDEYETAYRRPFAWVAAPNPEDGYLYLHDHGIPNAPTARPRMLEHQLGITVPSPAHQMLARNHWTATDPTTQRGGKLDCGDWFAYATLGCTVCMETDTRARVVMDVGAEPVEGAVRTQVLRLAGAHMWYVVPGTVTGIDADGGLEHHAGGLVRDDSARLVLTALLARAWYGQARQALRYTVNEIAPLVPVGSLV